MNDTKQLMAIDLGFNCIEGIIPVQLAQFGALVLVSLRHNWLTRHVPTEYYIAEEGVGFWRLFLDGNFLNGEVPKGLLKMKIFVGSVRDNWRIFFL